MARLAIERQLEASVTRFCTRYRQSTRTLPTIEGRTNDTNTIIARHTTGPGHGSTINSTVADASTARLDVLFRIDALERVLQSRDLTLAVRGIIARYVATYATRPSRSSDRIRGHG